MRRPRGSSVLRARAPESEGTTIRRLPLLVLVSLLLSASLTACGTWDPTNEPDAANRPTVIDNADADGSTGGQAELTVGDGTYNFSVTDCFADPDEGIRFTGRSADGDAIAAEYDPEAPDDAQVVVTNSDGVQVFTSDTSSGQAAPEFQMTEDGFRAVGAFVSDTDEAVEGSLSGVC